MPDEIDLGDGVTAEFDGKEIRLTDVFVDEPFTITLDQFIRLGEFVARWPEGRKP